MRISVVIPCHNAEPYIRQAIGSVLDQTLPPDEVIVVDDGSTDDSRGIAESFGEPVRVLAEESGSASATRMVGASAATGAALMFLDADDVVGPIALEALVDGLRRRPGGIAACPWHRLELEEGEWVERPATCRPRRADEDPLEAWLRGWYHPPCSVLWDRRAFERSGGWNPEPSPNDDGELMMRSLVLGIPLELTEVGAAYYRRLPGQTTTLSDTRLTEEGLASRVGIVESIASMLDDRDRLTHYRSALDDSLEIIEADASPQHPRIVDRCRVLRRRYGRSPTRHAAQLIGSRIRARLPRTRPPASRFPWHRRRINGPRPVRYGLEPRLNRGDPPSVSVIVPTYERAPTLPRALDSILAQSFEDFELLVVDDGSTDATPEIVDAYDDPRIRYLRQGENRGVSAARNRGMDESRGRFIAFLDSDDEWMPDKLRRQIRLFKRAPERVGLVYTGVEDVLPGGERRVVEPTERGHVHERMLRRNRMHGTSSVVMRRRVFFRVGYFDEDLPAIEDYDYWIRATRHFEVDFVAEPLLRYHDAPGLDRMSLEIEGNLEARRKLFAKHADAMRAAGVAHRFLRKTARRELARTGRRSVARRSAWAAFRERPDLETLPTLLRTVLPERMDWLPNRLARVVRTMLRPAGRHRDEGH